MSHLFLFQWAFVTYHYLVSLSFVSTVVESTRLLPLKAVATLVRLYFAVLLWVCMVLPAIFLIISNVFVYIHPFAIYHLVAVGISFFFFFWNSTQFICTFRWENAFSQHSTERAFNAHTKWAPNKKKLNAYLTHFYIHILLRYIYICTLSGMFCHARQTSGYCYGTFKWCHTMCSTVSHPSRRLSAQCALWDCGHVPLSQSLLFAVFICVWMCVVQHLCQPGIDICHVLCVV